jgi:hypothetical protein
MRYLVVLLCCFIYGCSHPLEIQGQGDIATLSGNSTCKLEDQPCKNIVAGAYQQTFIPVPREGWKFASWEGCSAQNLTCSFNIPEVPRSVWFKTMPSLKARFVKDSTSVQKPFDDVHLFYDARRNNIFISDKVGKAIYVVDGEDLKAKNLYNPERMNNMMPWSMAVTPDGNRLHVAFLKHEFQFSRELSSQGGRVARINLDTNFFDNFYGIDIAEYNTALTDQLDVGIDPFDMEAILTGPDVPDDFYVLIVSSGSGVEDAFSSYIDTYSPVFNLFLNRVYDVASKSKLRIEADGGWLIASVEDDILSLRRIFDITGGTLLSNDYFTQVKTPNETYRIERNGDVIIDDNDSVHASIVDAGDEIVDVAFDDLNGVFLAVVFSGPTNLNLRVYDLDTFEFLREIPDTDNFSQITIRNSKLYGYFYQNDEVTEIQYLP